MDNRTVELTGEQLLAARKVLKAAKPKGKALDRAIAAIRVTPNQVEFVIPGSAARSQAKTEGTFVVEMPWREFQVVMTERCGTADVVRMRFAEGVFDYNGVTSRSETIRLRNRSDPTEETWIDRVTINKPVDTPTDSASGYPLLTAYRHTRQYGIRQTLGNKHLLRRQLEVEKLLDTVAKKLKPLGLTRSDLETLLDQKLAT
ncbi:MAG: hypothetical protein U1F60_14035 [Planctomycetota bacterium]